MKSLRKELARLRTASDAAQAEVATLHAQLVGRSTGDSQPQRAGSQDLEEHLIYLRLMLNTIRQVSTDLRASQLAAGTQATQQRPAEMPDAA